MKLIPIEEVPENLHTIELQTGKIAKLYQAIFTRVKEVNLNEDIMVYKYRVPCPVCEYEDENIGFSYDGKYFNNTQMNCRHCGVFFRPVIKRG
jgi:hypothetical protein